MTVIAAEQLVRSSSTFSVKCDGESKQLITRSDI